MSHILVPLGDAHAYISRTLQAAGLSREQAEAAAEMMTEANLKGIDGHGIMRIPQYISCLRAGEIRLDADVTANTLNGSFGVVDAQGGYGFLPSLRAVDLADNLVNRSGVAVVAVRNSHHFGYAGGYVERLAQRGKVSILATNGQPLLVPPGGRKPVTGNNPIAVGVPRGRDEQPIVLDMALSKSSFGKIRWAAKENQPLPEGLAYDRHGNPTTNAVEALAAEALAPVGDHKGYGLSLVVEVLAGVMTGSPFGEASNAHGGPTGGVGHLFIALDPGRLGDATAFEKGVEDLLRQVRTAGTTDSPVYYPGEVELATVAKRRREGVPVAVGLQRELREVSEKLGVDLPAPLQ